MPSLKAQLARIATVVRRRIDVIEALRFAVARLALRVEALEREQERQARAWCDSDQAPPRSL